MTSKLHILRSLLTAVLIAAFLTATPGSSNGQSQSIECIDQSSAVQWLQSAIPVYWLHHSYIGYPPNIDWQSPDQLIAWAAEQQDSDLLTYRDGLHSTAAALEELGLPSDLQVANMNLQNVLTVTADILDTLLAPPDNYRAELEIKLEELFSLVSITDSSITQLIRACDLGSGIFNVSEEIACFDAMVPYHGDWAKSHYGGYIYFLANMGEARQYLDNEQTALARESIQNMRQAAADLNPAASPVSVRDLVMMTMAAYEAIANLLEMEADVIDGLASSEDLADVNGIAKAATDAMDRQAVTLFTPCDHILERFFSAGVQGSSSTSASTQRTREPASQSNPCLNATSWFIGSMRRLALANSHAEQFQADLLLSQRNNDSSHINQEVYKGISKDFSTWAEDQYNSNPPSAAEDLNNLLMDRLQHWSIATEIYGATRGDSSGLAEMSTEISAARQLGVRAIPLMRAFIDECGLQNLSSIENELSCFNTMELRGSRWFQDSSTILSQVIAFEDAFWSHIENGNVPAARQSISSPLYESWLAALEQLPVPAEGQPYVDAVADYVTTAVGLAEAYIDNSVGDVQYAEIYSSYEIAYYALLKEEREILAGCDPLLETIETSSSMGS